MAGEFDSSEFVDSDYQAARKGPTPGGPGAPAATPGPEQKAPTREEIESKVGEMQQKLSELKRAQQELERERVALEETRRRQVEFTTGRKEMVEQLTRGIGLLEEAEFAARRDAEQMSKALISLREALVKVQSVKEETWTRDNLAVELTRANTVIENARMEFNSARLKFTQLSGPSETPVGPAATAQGGNPWQAIVTQGNYLEMAKLGLALTWPVAAALLLFLVFWIAR